MQTRLAQFIADQIRDQIIEDGLDAGTKLPTEGELMNMYSASRSSIREAMKTLEAENIVEIRHGLGSFVAANTGLSKDPLGLSFEDQTRLLPEMMEVRLLMEPGIAEAAARRREESDLERLEEALQQMMEAHERGEDYHTWDYRFHIAIAQSTHNSVLKRMFPVIFEAVARGYAQTAQLEGSFQRAVEYHRGILNAIRAGDSAEAGRLCELHIRQTLQDIEEKLKGEKE